MTLEIYGIPRPERRPAARGHLKRIAGKVVAVAQTYTIEERKRKDGQPNCADWKNAVRRVGESLGTSFPNTQPLRLSVTFWMPRPKGHLRKSGAVKTGLPRHPIGKPDRDNLDKAVMDALVRSGLLADDAQITDGRIRKRWATDRPGGQPGATVYIREDRE